MPIQIDSTNTHSHKLGNTVVVVAAAAAVVVVVVAAGAAAVRASVAKE
jgi:hypothetical protein